MRPFWICLPSCVLVFAFTCGGQNTAANPMAEGLHKSGLARYRSGDKQGALRDLESAAQIAPESADIWNDLGVVQRLEGKPREAIISFRHAIGAQPAFIKA